MSAATAEANPLPAFGGAGMSRWGDVEPTKLVGLDRLVGLDSSEVARRRIDAMNRQTRPSNMGQLDTVRQQSLARGTGAARNVDESTAVAPPAEEESWLERNWMFVAVGAAIVLIGLWLYFSNRNKSRRR